MRLGCTTALVAATFVVATTVSAQVNEEARAVNEPLRRTISVVGTGKVSSAPDVADINVGVVTFDAAAGTALAANTEAMTAIQSLLKTHGVAEKDIQTISINIQPRYSQPQRNVQQAGEFVPRIVGYDVTNSVRITARDIKKLGAILDAVVKSGANQINGIAFRIDQADKLLDVARKQAMADARRKAEQLAGEAGVVVGLPISIQESGGYNPPTPRFGGARMEMLAAAAPVPVAAGEQEISVSVSVVYELQSAK